MPHIPQDASARQILSRILTLDAITWGADGGDDTDTRTESQRIVDQFNHTVWDMSGPQSFTFARAHAQTMLFRITGIPARIERVSRQAGGGEEMALTHWLCDQVGLGADPPRTPDSNAILEVF
ncbi:hypothetical protein LTR28_004795, partial [Elasticomyces elasticus]